MPPRASWRCLPCSLPSPLRRPSPSPFVRIPPTSRGLRAPVLRRAQRCGGRSRGAEEAPGGGPDDRDLIRILAEAARAGRGLGPQELADLVANFGAGDGGEQDGDAEAGKEREAEDFFDLPQAAKDVLSEAGVLDAVPWDGRLAVPPRFGKFLDEEDVDVLERLQEPPPVDEAEAEELRKAQMRAAEKVQRMLEDGPSIMDKVEDAYGAAVDDEEVDEDVVVSDINNLGEEEDEGYGDSPDDDLEGLFDVEAMERGMATLAAGEQLPDVKQYACEPEDAQSFKKRIEKMVDWYEDQFRPKADRKLTLEEARELSSHWEPIDSDPITFDEIEESIPPPDWPDWQERHFRRVQWMLYLLRLAHVNRGLTVPGERLHETGLIKDDVEFRSRELGIISGYDAWMKIMRNLQDNGAVSELANIWAKMNPPKEGAAEGTPCSWHIVVDHYINLPLPDWYLQEMTKVNEELDAANEEEEQDEDEPLDDWGDLFSNVELPKGGFEELEEMADYRNDIALMVKEAEKRRWQEERVAAEEAKQKRRGAEEARGGSPPGSTSDRDREGGESGPFWMEDGAGEAYLSGDVLTLNCTIMYEIDIEAGQIWRMKFGWAAALGNIKSAEDALMLFRKAAGSEHEGEGRDYSDWGHLRVNV